MTETLNPNQTPIYPRAITMWDFSWLERRWPGAGYEDWDRALDELLERGYNAVRIDAYPHLVGKDPHATYLLEPVWDQQSWGSCSPIEVQVQPALNEFLAKCRDRDIKVGLSSWYREDAGKVLMEIDGPSKMAENWIRTLESIASDGLLDVILYTDLCNEWPGEIWCPYFRNDPPEHTWGYWHTEVSMKWMRESIEKVREAFPDMPLLYSFDGMDVSRYSSEDLSFMDLIEHHSWMVKENDGEFCKAVGYNYERFSSVGYRNLALSRPHEVYEQKKDYWQQLLVDKIRTLATHVAPTRLPLVTTECWGIVDYKDWPMLPWDWVKELCALGVETASASGQWAAIASSNFCGPQFVGMWRDVQWHQSITEHIRSTPIDCGRFESKLIQRL